MVTVRLLWKRTIDDFVTPLENIESDRIVGIRCDFDNCDPLFILSVYLLSSKATITRCDLSPRFLCTDATLFCECKSDKI